MRQEGSGTLALPTMVGGASAFGGKPPRVLVLALKPDGGLLLWPLVRDSAARQWAEVPSMPEAEAELRAAHAQAMRQAPKGAKPREGRGVGLPKLEFGPNGRVRVDVNWSGVQHHLYPATLSPSAFAALWKLWLDPLPVAEIPRPLPSRLQFSTPKERKTGGHERPFEWESQLEDYLIKNWDRLPLSTSLEIIGQQHPTTDRGRIDIFCRNKDESGYTVIELKRGQTGDAVVGQVLRYMGWVRGDRLKGDQSVWGIIICHEADPKLKAAISVTPNVDVYTYERSTGQADESDQFVLYRLPKND